MAPRGLQLATADPGKTQMSALFWMVHWQLVFKIKGMTKITQITNPKLTSIAVSKEQQRTAIEALTRSDVAFEADRI